MWKTSLKPRDTCRDTCRLADKGACRTAVSPCVILNGKNIAKTGGFLKWWYPTTIGFPTKNDHFGVFLGVPPFTETPNCFTPPLIHKIRGSLAAFLGRRLATRKKGAIKLTAIFRFSRRSVARNSCIWPHTIHVWYIYLHLVVFNGKLL